METRVPVYECPRQQKPGPGDMGTCTGLSWGLLWCLAQSYLETSQGSYTTTYMYLCTPAHVHTTGLAQDEDRCGTHIPGRWRKATEHTEGSHPPRFPF